jgi:hypothetical protein
LDRGHGHRLEKPKGLRICPSKLLPGPRRVIGDDIFQAVSLDVSKDRNTREDFILPLPSDLSFRPIFVLALQVFRIEAKLGLLVFFKHNEILFLACRILHGFGLELHEALHS